MEEMVNSRYLLMLLVAAAMLLPPLLAWGEHIYLRHGEVSGKRRVLYLLLYFVLIHAVVFGAAYVRGLYFQMVTLDYAIRHLGFGLICALIAPFFCCLILESDITPHGLQKYSRRLFRDVRRYSQYVVRSAGAYLRAEVVNSYLDWLWWLIEPFCMMLIYTMIFGVVFHASEQYFPVFIFIGITMWGFFSRSVSGSVNTVRGSKGIITKIYMPKYILLLSKMFVNGFKMMVSFGVVLVMMLVFRVPVTWRILYAVPIIAVLFLFTFGVGTIMMHYGVYVSDLGYITGIVLSMLMYFTGTFYDVAKRIPDPFGDLIAKLNPVAFLISAMRDVLLYETTPAVGMLFLWGGLSVILIALGAFTIYSNENAYVKII